MVEVDISILFAGLSIAASIVYYASVLRNQNKTRQLQLFMQLFQRYAEPEFHQKAEHELWLEWEWDDYEDFQRKYGVGNLEALALLDTTLTWLDGIGVLVKRGHIDAELVNETVFAMVEGIWEKFNPITMEFRKETNYPQLWTNFEYLYNVTKPLTVKKRKEHSNP